METVVMIMLIVIVLLVLLGLGLGIWRYKAFRRRRSARIAPAGAVLPMHVQPHRLGQRDRNSDVDGAGLGAAVASRPPRKYSMESTDSVNPNDNTYRTISQHHGNDSVGPRSVSATDKPPPRVIRGPFRTRPPGLHLPEAATADLGDGGPRGLAATLSTPVSSVSSMSTYSEEIGLERITQAEGALAAAPACATPTADAANEGSMADHDTMTSFDMSVLPYDGSSERENQRLEKARQHVADAEWYQTTAFRH